MSNLVVTVLVIATALADVNAFVSTQKLTTGTSATSTGRRATVFLVQGGAGQRALGHVILDHHSVAAVLGYEGEGERG